MCFHYNGNPPAFGVESGRNWKGVVMVSQKCPLRWWKKVWKQPPFNVNISGVTRISKDFPSPTLTPCSWPALEMSVIRNPILCLPQVDRGVQKGSEFHRICRFSSWMKHVDGFSPSFPLLFLPIIFLLSHSAFSQWCVFSACERSSDSKITRGPPE